MLASQLEVVCLIFGPMLASQLEVIFGPMLASQPCLLCFLGFDIPTSFIFIENVFYYSCIYILVSLA